MKDALTEAMDVEGLKRVLEGHSIETNTMFGRGYSRAFAVFHEILNANPYAYLDDAPLEERRARAVEMRRALPEAVLSGDWAPGSSYDYGSAEGSMAGCARCRRTS